MMSESSNSSIGIPCKLKATYEITWAPYGCDDYTHSCEIHLGQMVGINETNHENRITKAPAGCHCCFIYPRAIGI